MAFPLWVIPTAIQGVKTLYTALNKPKQVMPEETMAAMNKMIANQQSDIRNKTLMNMLTSAAKSQGAQQYQQQQHQLDIMRNRGDLSEGQYAKGLLNAGTTTQSVVGQQTQNAALEQYKQNKSAMQMIDQARLSLAQIKDQYRQQLKQESQQWKNELAGGVLDTATTAFNGIMENVADKKLNDSVTKYLGGRNYSDLSLEERQGLLNMVYLQYLGVDLNNVGVVAPTPTNVQTAAPTSETFTNPQDKLNFLLNKGTDNADQEMRNNIWNPLYSFGNMLPEDMPKSLENDYTNGQPSLPEQVSRKSFVNASNTFTKPGDYQTMYDVLVNEYGGDPESAAFKDWVKKTYSIKGTYDKFMMIWNAARGI